MSLSEQKDKVTVKIGYASIRFLQSHIRFGVYSFNILLKSVYLKIWYYEINED